MDLYVKKSVLEGLGFKLYVKNIGLHPKHAFWYAFWHHMGLLARVLGGCRAEIHVKNNGSAPKQKSKAPPLGGGKNASWGGLIHQTGTTIKDTTNNKEETGYKDQRIKGSKDTRIKGSKDTRNRMKEGLTASWPPSGPADLYLFEPV